MTDSAFIAIDGRRIEVRRAGPPGPPGLVLLHEGLGCAAMWRDFPECLASATGRGVLAYSRLGYGASDTCDLPRPLTYMQDEGQGMLPHLLDAIGFEAGVLIGHSDGASIAAVYAGAMSDPRLTGLVLMAPHFFTEEMGLTEIAHAREAFETTDLRERLARYHGENVDCAFWGWNGAWLDPEFRKWDLRAFLPRITVPTLVIQGLADQYGSVAQDEAMQAGSGGPVEVVLLPDCAHSPQRDQPQRTLEAIAGFLRALPKGIGPA